MKKEISLVFPNQLFEQNPSIEKNRPVVLIEHPRFFSDFKFHKQKILLHRASLKKYEANLKRKGYHVTYVDHKKVKGFLSKIKKGTVLHYVDVIDHDLDHQLQRLAAKKGLDLLWYESPMFLSPTDWLDTYFQGKKRFLMGSFYQAQRKRLNILMNGNKPVGGRWTYDDENRQSLKQGALIPQIKKLRSSSFTREAALYVEKNFKNNPGNIASFIYPISSIQAKKWFDSFLNTRLKNFGTYQDAMVEGESFLFHSVLSSSLNIGLLTPEYITERAISYSKKHKIAINNLEGFIRQIIGWREYVRGVYRAHGKKQKKSNFFGNRKQLPKSFYTATVGILPVDDCIQKLQNTAYSHHIERLMILGNTMLLMGIKPNDVYRWFMELYIDSYDWVMVPNVYGMSQYADSSMVTKPYIASSNYILKMSNYKRGDWCDKLDELFWSFVAKHRTRLSRIPRMSFIIKLLKRKLSQ